MTALFCNNAETEANGMLNIHGVFNELYAPDFPAKQDRIVLVGIVEWQRDVSGREPFRIDLTDPDGDPIFTVDGYTDVKATSESEPPAKTHFILPLENVIFTQPGRYATRIELHGKTFAGPSLHLMKSQPERKTSTA
ncbi:MAG: hypothetical protein MJA83_08885 [Gammaproteobacteria bacterium]|nr:hypothetical protein [Gammaproteobacteria bacterium]